jgi:general stress protein YciG
MPRRRKTKPPTRDVSETEPKTPSKRGFAGMSAEKQRKIAAAGGKAAHGAGVAHQFDATTASKAGRKGGRVVARDRAHMAEIGRKGGSKRKKRKTKSTKEGG